MIIREANHGETGVSNVLEDIENKTNISGNLIMKEGKVIYVTCKNTERTEKPLTQEQQETMSPMLYEDVKNYYTQYFQNEASQIDDLIGTYFMIQDMPIEMKMKTTILKSHLYTKIKLLANGDKFFEQLGIPNKDVKLTCQKAKKCLESKREVTAHNSKLQHKYDLEFLYAIIQNDIIDTILSGQEYTEENLVKLMEDVKTNWQSTQFLDKEFKGLLDEILLKTMSDEDIIRGTVNVGIGTEEINAIIAEIKSRQNEGKQQYMQE